MTDPSPQEELRAELVAWFVRDCDNQYDCPGVDEHEHYRQADALLPLFAARVAAIEADNERLRKYAEIDFHVTNAFETAAVDWKSRAVKAEAELTAMTEMHYRIKAADEADLTAAQGRIAAIQQQCELTYDFLDRPEIEERGYVTAGTLCGLADQILSIIDGNPLPSNREQRAEERVAAERKQAAAQIASLEYDLEYARKHLPCCHHGTVLAYASCRDCRLEEGIPTP